MNIDYYKKYLKYKKKYLELKQQGGKTCGPNEIKVRTGILSSKCVECGENQIKQGNQCIKCGDDEEEKYNDEKKIYECVKCGENQIKQGNQCVKCGENQIKQNNQCIECLKDHVKDRNRCIKLKNNIYCDDYNTIYVDGECKNYEERNEYIKKYFKYIENYPNFFYDYKDKKYKYYTDEERNDYFEELKKKLKCTGDELIQYEGDNVPKCMSPGTYNDM